MLQLPVPASIGENHIVWKLEPWLAARGKSRNQLAEAMSGELASNRVTVYRLEGQKRLDFATLTRIIRACEQLTGERPGVGDLLEYREG